MCIQRIYFSWDWGPLKLCKTHTHQWTPFYSTLARWCARPMKQFVLWNECSISATFQCNLEISPEALRAIARQAMERKTGARGLRAILVRFSPGRSCQATCGLIWLQVNRKLIISICICRNGFCWILCLKCLVPTSVTLWSRKTVWRLEKLLATSIGPTPPQGVTLKRAKKEYRCPLRIPDAPLFASCLPFDSVPFSRGWFDRLFLWHGIRYGRQF